MALEEEKIPSGPPPVAVEGPYWIVQLFSQESIKDPNFSPIRTFRIPGRITYPMPGVATWNGKIYRYNGVIKDGMFAYVESSVLDLYGADVVRLGDA